MIAVWFAQSPGLAWTAAGLVLLVLDVLLPGLFLVWLGIAAVGTGVLTRSFGLSFRAEAALFALLAAVAIALGLALRRSSARRRQPTLNTAQSGLVGRRAVALAFQGIEGRVRVGDSDWAARLAPGSAAIGPATILPGTLVEVTGVDGTMLMVRPEPRA